MLEQTRSLAADRGITNVITRQAAAEELPFSSKCFELVTCRIAPHHFEDCTRFVREAARALVEGGILLIQDHLLPDDPGVGREIDRFERTRDPSHRRAYSEAEWVGMLQDAGLTVFHRETVLKRHHLLSWVERQGGSTDLVEELRAQMEEGSDRLREWMEPQDWSTPRASFLNRHLIIAGRKDR
jgi:SAM-dependent methyltransferase